MDSNSIVNAGGPGQLGAMPFSRRQREKEPSTQTAVPGWSGWAWWSLAARLMGWPRQNCIRNMAETIEGLFMGICIAVALMGATRRRHGRLGSTQPWRMD